MGQRHSIACALVAPLVVLAGCMETGPLRHDQSLVESSRQLAAAHDPRLRPFIEALYRDGEWNAVLNFQQLALAAMEIGELKIAADSLDSAITRVEAIYADDENARKARSAFNQEAVKDFKGEPYERAMLYYYRGLLYAHEGDFQNARAAFLAADRHDTLSSAEDREFAGDFGMMKYLAGWASYCDGDETRGGQLVNEAKASDDLVRRLPDRPPKRLLLVDAGGAPEKYREGQFGERLKFRASALADDDVRVHPSESGPPNPLPLVAIGDVAYQARTRGGREVDAILAGKAQFKETAATVAAIGTQTGALMSIAGAQSGQRDVMNAGFASMLASVIASAISDATAPQADVRAWRSLPSRVLMADLTNVPSSALRLTGASGARPLTLHPESRHACSIAYGRTTSPLMTADGGVVTTESVRPQENGREQRNAAFRDELTTRFAPGALATR